jgi:heat shock protein HslJ
VARSSELKEVRVTTRVPGAKLSAVLAVAVTLAGTALADGVALAEGEPSLVGPIWVAEDIGRRGVIDDVQSHVAFTAEGQAQGSSGCNNFRGAYALRGETLEIGPLASTKKACPPAIMDQETRFFEALAQTRSYRFENGLLYLSDAQGMPVMRLWRRD